MIERIEVENFQSHRSSEIELGPGLNVIVGSSDSGKTAILRALNMVMKNKPSSVSLISHWAKRAGKVIADLVVRVRIDGRWIERRRGKGNSYALDKESFNAMGSSVPEPIAKFLNMSDVNVQGQHDGVFLLSKSGGEVGRQLNKVVHLDKIDSAISEIDSRRRKTTSELKESKSRIDSLILSVAQLAWVDEAEVVIDKLEKTQSQLQIEAQGRDKVQMLMSNIESIDLSQFEWIPGVERKLQDVDNVVVFKGEVAQLVSVLGVLLADIEEIQIDETDYSEAGRKVDEVQVICQNVLELKDKVERLLDVVASVRSEGRALKVVQEELEKSEREFHALMPDECPLCEQEWKR